jgi:hypothetical protein
MLFYPLVRIRGPFLTREGKFNPQPEEAPTAFFPTF